MLASIGDLRRDRSYPGHNSKFDAARVIWDKDLLDNWLFSTATAPRNAVFRLWRNEYLKNPTGDQIRRTFVRLLRVALEIDSTGEYWMKGQNLELSTHRIPDVWSARNLFNTHCRSSFLVGMWSGCLVIPNPPFEIERSRG